MLRSASSSDSGLGNQFPKRLKTLVSNVTFSEGNHLLHQFVLDNSSPNDSGSENYINAVLLSMCNTSVNALNNEGYCAIHLAVLKNNVLMVAKMLSCLETLQVNIKDKGKNTALHLATIAGHVPIMQELLNNGADVNAQSGFYKRTPLHLAVQGDNLNFDIITLLLERGANVNIVDEYGNTALHLVAITGHVLIMQELLNNGADVNALNYYCNSTPLHLAINRDDLKFNNITLLLKIQAMNAQGIFSGTALHLATAAGHILIMQELLNNGADVNARCGFYKRTPLHLAVQGNNLNLDIIRLLLERGANVNAQDVDNNTALHLATKAGHVPIMQELLNNGADVNAQVNNRTALHMAFQGDNLNLDIITLLLERGANVNAQDQGNNTALHLATKAGHVLIMQELLNNGADVNAQGGYYSRTTSLHSAFQGDYLNLDIITLLLERGADVNAQDVDNNTALHLATKAGHIPIMQELLSNGADVNAQGKYSQTPLQLAKEIGNLSICEMLCG